MSLLQEMKSFNGARLIPPDGTFYALLHLRGSTITRLNWQNLVEEGAGRNRAGKRVWHGGAHLNLFLAAR